MYLIILRNVGGIMLLLMYLVVILLAFCWDSMLLISLNWKDIGGVLEMLHCSLVLGNNLSIFLLTGILVSWK